VTVPVTRVEWKPSWRIIPSRFPPVDLFERVADPTDLDAIFKIEALTNDRLREQVGTIELVPAEDRVSGPGTSIIMAAFTHLNPEGSRFSDGTFGVFYAAKNLETAIAETKYHRERFMRATNEARLDLDMRVYLVDLEANLHDLRGLSAQYPLVYHAEDYGGGQHLARSLRKTGSNGIAYDSVRWSTGECVAVFRPRLLSNCRQGQHLAYVWNGAAIVDVYEKRSLT
jgi:hypothetical protein